MSLRSAFFFYLSFFLILAGLGAAPPSSAEIFRNPQRIPLPLDPWSIATGDLNGDGRNDIVWIERPNLGAQANLHILLASAAGQYLPAPDVSLPYSPAEIHCVIQDVTGDKRNDLICADATANNNFTDVYLLTYAGNGDGTFATPVQTKISVQSSAFGYPILARAGDINGDGMPDLMLTSADGGGGVAYLSDGHGGFKPGTIFEGSFNYSVPKIADINGDGKLDVLWPTGPRVNLGNGDGTFSTPIQYDPGFLSNCAFGDVDHDGHMDAACTWYDSSNTAGHINLTVLHGNADGSFSTTPLFTRTFGTGETQYDGTTTILAPVLIADINSDGNADIVSISGDGYCVLLGGPNATWNGQPSQFVSASFQSEFGLYGIYGVSIADMNGDGLPDIVAVGPNGLYITYAQPDGSLSSAPAYEVGQVSTSVTLVDINGDGNLDVVSAGDTALKLSLGKGDGTFGSPQPITSTDNFGDADYEEGQVISGDFNGDGKQDLLATGVTGPYTTQNYILFGHGDGSFDTPKPVSVSLGKVVDLNKDGRSDVLSILNNSTSSANVAQVSLSNGDGTFTTVATNLPAEPYSNYIYPSVGPALADFRHSGLLDLAVASFDNAYVLQGRGDGSFTYAGTALAIPKLPGLNKVDSAGIATGDFDHDGNQDIAVLMQYETTSYGSASSAAVWVFYGKGDGTFSSAVLAATFNRPAMALNAGDLNGDGLDDLVLSYYNVYFETGLLTVHALPNRAWGPEVDYAGGEGLWPLWITDINHDGRNDMVVANAHPLNQRANSVAVLLNQPASTASGLLTATPEPSLVTYSFTLNVALFPSTTTDVLTGNVTFSLDGIVIGTAPLSQNVASLRLSGSNVAVGQHTLSASWPGSGTYPALVLNGTHTVSLLPLDLSFTATPASLGFGSLVNGAVTLTFPAPPNTAGFQTTAPLTLHDNGVAIAQEKITGNTSSFTVPSLAVGTHALSVSYPGDTLFSPASSNTVNVTVLGLASVSTLSAAPTTVVYGAPVTLSASVAAASLPQSSLPTGSMVFLVDGKTQATVSLTNAAASTVFNNLPVGTHSISCTYSGDSVFAASTCNTVSVAVNPAPSALTITSSQNPAVAYTPITYTIHLTLNGQPAPAGTQFTFSLMSNSGNVLLTTDASGNATYTTSQLFARTWDVVAAFYGANYISSTTHYSQVVTAAPTVLTLTASPNPAYLYQDVIFSAATTPSGTTFPTGPVQFLEVGNVIGIGALNSNGQARFDTSTLPVGTHTITASYAGDAGFLPATSTPVSLVVTPADAVLTTDHGTLSLQTEHHSSIGISLTSVGGLTGAFTLTCGPLPAWATCSFQASTLTLPANGVATTTLNLDTDAVRDFKSTVQQSDRPGQPGSKLPLLALTPLAWLTFSLRRKQRANLGGFRHFTVAFALLTCAWTLTGCGNKYPAHTAPGSYAVQVTATSTPGSTPIPMTRTATFTLVVTP